MRVGPLGVSTAEHVPLETNFQRLIPELEHNTNTLCFILVKPHCPASQALFFKGTRSQGAALTLRTPAPTTLMQA